MRLVIREKSVLDRGKFVGRFFSGEKFGIFDK